MFRNLARVFAPLLVALIPISAAVGQEDDGGTSIEAGCGYINEGDCSAGYHQVRGDGLSSGSHAECMKCTSGGSSCHGMCWGLALGDTAVYHALASALTNGSPEKVIQAGMSAPDFVFVNWTRMSVQVLSCNGGSIVANIPIEPSTANLRLLAELDRIRADRIAVGRVLPAVMTVASQ